MARAGTDFLFMGGEFQQGILTFFELHFLCSISFSSILCLIYMYVRVFLPDDGLGVRGTANWGINMRYVKVYCMTKARAKVERMAKLEMLNMEAELQPSLSLHLHT